MSDTITPLKLDLKKTERLKITWIDGQVDEYPILYLRAKCPCANCKVLKEQQQSSPRKLMVLPENYTSHPEVVSAELVGGYALKLVFSDGHATGIYSYRYLREIAPRETTSSDGRK